MNSSFGDEGDKYAHPEGEDNFGPSYEEREVPTSMRENLDEQGQYELPSFINRTIRRGETECWVINQNPPAQSVFTCPQTVEVFLTYTCNGQDQYTARLPIELLDITPPEISIELTSNVEPQISFGGVVRYVQPNAVVPLITVDDVCDADPDTDYLLNGEPYVKDGDGKHFNTSPIPIDGGITPGCEKFLDHLADIQIDDCLVVVGVESQFNPPTPNEVPGGLDIIGVTLVDNELDLEWGASTPNLAVVNAEEVLLSSVGKMPPCGNRGGADPPPPPPPCEVVPTMIVSPDICNSTGPAMALGCGGTGSTSNAEASTAAVRRFHGCGNPVGQQCYSNTTGCSGIRIICMFGQCLRRYNDVLHVCSGCYGGIRNRNSSYTLGPSTTAGGNNDNSINCARQSTTDNRLDQL